MIVRLVHRRALFWIDRAVAFEGDLRLSSGREAWNPAKRMIRARHDARKHRARHGREVEYGHIKAMQSHHPDVPIYLAAVDDHLNEVGYIVPGLGDAGDRQFGTG